MRLIAIGLASVLLAAVSPVMAFAADAASKSAATKVVPDDPKSHATGMAEAPPIAQQAGVPCTITDANYIGQQKSKDAKGVDVLSKYYELVCQDGLGYVLIAPQPGTPSSFDCLALTTNKPASGQPDKGQLYCRLAANADPIKGMQPLIAKAGLTCTPQDARWMGASADQKFDQFEVGCSEGRAYVLQSPQAGSTHPLTAIDCLTLDPAACKFFPQSKLVALLTQMAAPANRACQITNGRLIGTSATNKNSFYELACSDEKAGYVLQVDANAKFVSAIDCARASTIGNGCTLTSASAAQTAEIGTYARLAKEIGYPCTVSAYHSFGLDQKSGREVVELACSDHADGAIALFPVDKGQTGEFYNCVRAGARSLKCALTTDAAAFPKISSQLAAKGKTCQVSNARSVGVTSTGSDFVEAACTGAPGLMIEYAPGPETVKSIVTCADAKGIGGGCTLK